MCICVCVWFSARPRGFNNIDLTYLISIDSPSSSKKYLLIVCTFLQLIKLRHREGEQLPQCLIPELQFLPLKVQSEELDMQTGK